ncbi:hypothetical protein Tco_0105030 [Tanacetum coccineum]
MQKYILKQQFEGFTISNTDGIHKGYERFQSLLSQLDIHEQQYEQTSSYSLLAIQSSCPQLDHEDLDQVDEYDLEEMDLKWQVVLISRRMKKFLRETECRTKEDNRRRDGWNPRNKDGSRTGKKEESKALVTLNGERVD